MHLNIQKHAITKIKNLLLEDRAPKTKRHSNFEFLSFPLFLPFSREKNKNKKLAEDLICSAFSIYNKQLEITTTIM